MVTAAEAQSIRQSKASVNHKTYKSIYEKICNRIKLAAERGDTSVRYRIPPFIPDRPLFEMSHAMRYNRDKLRHAEFTVTEVGDDTLEIDWKTPATKKPPPPKPKPAPSVFKSRESISEKLLDLKKKLKL